MNSALIEMDPPDVNEVRTIQRLQFKFSKQFIKHIKKRLQNAKKNIAKSTLVQVPENYKNCLNNMIKYWMKDYDFGEQEKFFNQFPHFRTTVDEINIHYIHVKPPNPERKVVYPLLMLHGWPSSVMEFYDIIPHLITATSLYDFVFEVIIPSLPGFGGSSCLSYQKLKCHYIAEILVKFMCKINRDRFYVHCDDWCVFVVHAMSLKHSDNLLGVHYALCQVENMSDLCTYILSKITNIQDMRKEEQNLKNEYYNTAASLCIQTFGMGLLNSPTALIAYLFEKFVKDSIYSDTLDIIENYKCVKFLNTVMMYWATSSIVTSLKAYQGYLAFEGYITDEIDFNDNIFTAITLFLPRSLRPNISIIDRENSFVLCIYKNKSSRFPAVEEPAILANAIFQHIFRQQLQ